ncbi:MAG: hypothetical protein NVS9B12_08010 [Vulcanimicrobiaceae bacterium]
MNVRPALRGDVEAILDLYESVAAEELWIATEPGFNRELYVEFISTVSRRTETTVAFVAVDEKNAIVGEVSAYRDPDSDCWSVGMLVLKQYRRIGVGAALLTRVVDWAKRAQIPELSLEVFVHNEAALALYRRFGFVQKAYHKEHLVRRNGERWDTIEMVLKVGR